MFSRNELAKHVNPAPVLLIGYNRPEKMETLISSLAVNKPKNLLVCVDGPKNNREGDREKVERTRDCINQIRWDCKVQTLFRETNLGLQQSVVGAVDWAISEFGSVVVLEDDIQPGKQMLPYAWSMLENYRSDNLIGHISLYNNVPKQFLLENNFHSRISRFPESYCWATWERSWCNYDDSLSWGLNAPLSELATRAGGLAGALKWRLNFMDASKGRIQTWAYRWLASLWANNQFALAPNKNLGSYSGWSDGTHTFRKPKFKEQPVSHLDFGQLTSSSVLINLSEDSEKYLSKEVFGESISGILEGIAASFAMEIRDSYKKIHSRT